MLAALDERRKSEHARLYEQLASKRYHEPAREDCRRPAIKKVGADRTPRHRRRPIDPTDRARRMRVWEKSWPTTRRLRVFHKLRVRIKRLRYELEMMAPLGAKRHRKTLARLEELQELLGRVSRRDRRDRLADVVCRNLRRAAPHDARGRRIDSFSRQAREQTSPSMHEGVEALRAFRRDARYARGNSASRQVKPEAGQLARAGSGRGRIRSADRTAKSRHSNHNSTNSHSATATTP